MKHCTILRCTTPSALVITFGICAASMGAEPTTSAVDEFNYRTVAAIDRHLYTSEIAKSDIARTGSASPGSPLPEGIGVVAAAEKARAAFKTIEVGDHAQWMLHSVSRKQYSGAGWVYYAAFVKRTERMPDYMGNQLQITVLLDGSVIPVQQKPNPGPAEAQDAQNGAGGLPAAPAESD